MCTYLHREKKLLEGLLSDIDGRIYFADERAVGRGHEHNTSARAATAKPKYTQGFGGDGADVDASIFAGVFDGNDATSVMFAHAYVRTHPFY